MSETLLQLPKPATNPASDADRQRGRDIQKGIKSILREAVQIKAVAFDELMRMRDQFDDEESADHARARAQAVTALIKGWETTVEAIRVARNKPLPGSRRPLPEQPKVRKSKPANKPPSLQRPAACVPDAPTAGVPSDPLLVPKPQEPAKP